MHKVHISKNPKWYGFPGDVTSQDQNRVLPTWEGATHVGAVNLSGLHAGAYKGSLGANMSGLSARAMDQIVLGNMGVRLGDSGPGGTTSTGPATSGKDNSMTGQASSIAAATPGIVAGFDFLTCLLRPSACNNDGSSSSTDSTATDTGSSADSNAAMEQFLAAQATSQRETMTYVAVGVGALAILGLGYVLLKK